MRMYDIIQRKKRGNALTDGEIQFVVQGVTDGSVPDYQIAALLMAITLKGMTAQETTALTLAMAKSGDMLDLSPLDGIKVDKHSTGGVGDKTTLIVAPMVAAMGVTVAKMSGRSLGHTGGTVDKLEGIPGFETSLSMENFFATVRKCGICIAGQSMSLAPADKKIYALRDVTATVDSIPLIAASIMSKKIAAGADRILLDVKTGNGAFMKSPEDARELAQAMVEIGNTAGRKTAALITDMSVPLGFAVGNNLEIIESIEVLKGGGPADLRHVCIELAAYMMHLADKGELPHCRALAEEAITGGKALETFAQVVEAQNGDRAFIDDPARFPAAAVKREVTAVTDGYIREMDTEGIGVAALLLGAGRETAADTIDHSAGLILHAKVGDRVEKGQPLVTLHTASEEKANIAAEKYLSCLSFSDNKTEKSPLIHAEVR
ncbi:MAG: pyrimidine-nucleoside phosphorylase [Defluviitaleaceae bacterium]|nr:pyrimidine-nucleoside phosphorylase [Defluviitaleaceae bacterium]MCL2274333.1 pyrimidine-nucleoside phosphorylase [Defluviitaleaceae bacterium]